MDFEAPYVLHPDFAPLHAILQEQLTLLDPRANDSLFSDHIISSLLPLFSGLETERFEQHFSAFIEQHHSLLNQIYLNHDFDLDDSYGPTHAWSVLHTPAALLVFERALNGNRFVLQEYWQNHVYDGEFLLPDLLLQIGLTV